MLKQDTTVVLTIEKPAAGGRMIARHEGAVVLVSGAIPGETVEARVERVQRGTVWATTTKVVDPSPDRVASRADWACGGAVFSHVAYPRQLALKREIVTDAFRRIGKMDLPGPIDIASSPRDAYRMRARLHVRRGRIGFFREGTHDWCDPGPTGQLMPEAVAALKAVERGLSAWPAGVLSDVVLAENVAGTERLVHLELARGIDAGALPGIGPLEGVAGLSAASSGRRAVHLAGLETIADDLQTRAGTETPSFRLTRHAASFFQGNRFLLQPLVDAVMDATPAGPMLDLYAGVGLFSAAAAARGDTVVAVEGDRDAAADLRANAGPFGDRLRTYHEPVEGFLHADPRDVLAAAIVDPPRTGMSAEALAGLVRVGALRIVYVSCDVATLARDARRFVDAGYTVTRVSGFDLFPETAHVESLAVFER
jgi:23S rRNA (uracil1939-C5)-methyltransferase